MQHASIRAQEVNTAKLAGLYRRQFALSNVQKGETIAIVSDLGTRREYIQAAFAAADELGADIYEMCVNSIPSWTKVGVATIGQCKGTLEAVKAADLVVIFHVPLFTKWLKAVMDGGTRVLMVIDAPDDLEQLMSPKGLKEAMKYAEGVYRQTRDRAGDQRGRHRLHLLLRRVSGDDASGASPTRRGTSTIGAPGTSTPSPTRAARTAPW